MDGARHQLFAGTALARDQHGCLRRRDAGDAFDDPAQRVARTDQALAGTGRHGRIFQTHHGRRRALAGDGLLEHAREVIERDGLGDEVEGPGAQSVDRHVDVPKGGHQQDGHLRPVTGQALAKLDAAHARHAHVGDDGGGDVLMDRRERALGVGLGVGVVTELLQRVLRGLADLVVVLDDQYPHADPTTSFTISIIFMTTIFMILRGHHSRDIGVGPNSSN